MHNILIALTALAVSIYAKVPGFERHMPSTPYHHGQPNLTTLSTYAEAQHYLTGLYEIYKTNTLELLESNSSQECSISNLSVRRAWDDLSDFERAQYIDAVYCLARKPARTDVSVVPGVRNWIDDFVWQHINQTNFVHVSGLLLPWHRQFLFAFEQSLQKECGYRGSLPYWPWERHANNQSQSPVFQPGKYSFGTDGGYIDKPEIFEPFVGLPQPFNVTRAPGTGGWYVSDGAFGNHTGWRLNIGPVTPPNNTLYSSNNTPPYEYGQRYNPRPLKRDMYQPISSQLLNYTGVAQLMQQDNIHTFHPLLENNGVHLGGHFYIGGDGGDIYSSPNEPTFWLHHANVDRLWTIWQAQDFESRGNALDGTVTVANIPPSDNATLDTVMRMGIPGGGDIPIRNAMSSTAHGHCNVYA